jgi:hypothetical protein
MLALLDPTNYIENAWAPCVDYSITKKLGLMVHHVKKKTIKRKREKRRNERIRRITLVSSDAHFCNALHVGSSIGFRVIG